MASGCNGIPPSPNNAVNERTILGLCRQAYPDRMKIGRKRRRLLASKKGIESSSFLWISPFFAAASCKRINTSLILCEKERVRERKREREREKAFLVGVTSFLSLLLRESRKAPCFASFGAGMRKKDILLLLRDIAVKEGTPFLVKIAAESIWWVLWEVHGMEELHFRI